MLSLRNSSPTVIRSFVESQGAATTQRSRRILSEPIGRRGRRRMLAVAVLVSAPWLGAWARDTAGSAAAKDPWRRSIELITEGRFDAATQTVEQLGDAHPLTGKLKTWLEGYQEKQARRAKMDQEELERYTRYAKERIERKEWTQALDWVWLAADVAPDREEFLRRKWVQDLINAALEEAQDARKKQDWRGAWDVYGRLSALFEQEPRYQQLERDALTHLRLEMMFRKDAKWRERIENVRWEHAQRALEYVEDFYVTPVDFKEITASGIRQLLLLAESQSARDALEGLRNEDDRFDFEVRLKERLAQVEAAPSLLRRDGVRHFRRIVDEINKETVRLPDELIVSELMRGALQPLDEFTTVIWPKEIEEFEKHTRGDFIGVGIQIIKNKANEIEVVTPLDDTPAYRAGIQAGDVIIAVDGEPLVDISINKVVDIITGPRGTEVTLQIRRQGEEFDVPLVRELVKIQSVKGVRRDREHGEQWDYWLDREMGVAYVRVTNFQRNTVEDVENALHDLRAEGMKGLVLDLRGNPGGLLDSAYRMASLFLKKGEGVVSTKGRIPEENHEFKTEANGPFADLPLTVLVDESSASASEIVSGAIRDNKRGIVVGARTFGKFSVQNLIPLGYSQAKLKLTTASYYLPSGVSLHRTPTSQTWGVQPTVPVRLVRWERQNLWQMRREADLLGPPTKAGAPDDHAPDSEAPDGAPPSEQAEDSGAKDESSQGGQPDDGATTVHPAIEKEKADGTKASDDSGDGEGKSDLPPLKQPDDNNRPKEDPQLDTALLIMRAALLKEAYPTLAAVKKEDAAEEARP